VNTRLLATEFSLPIHGELVVKDIEVANWYNSHEDILIKYFSAIVLAVIDDTIRQAVEFYHLEDDKYVPSASNVITLTIHHWS